MGLSDSADIESLGPEHWSYDPRTDSDRLRVA